MSEQQPSRAAALSAVVALVTAHRDGVDIDRAVLTEGTDDRQVADAAVWLCALLTEHVKDNSGVALLQIAGRVAGFVDAAHGP